MAVLPKKLAHLEPKSIPFSPVVRQAIQRRRKEALTLLFVRLIVLVGLLLAWQLGASAMGDSLVLCTPGAVLAQLVAWINDGTLWMQSTLTIQEILLGLVFGVSSGILAALVLGLVPLVAQALDPFVRALYGIPKIALAPLFIVWFGIELEMKIVFVAVTVFFLVFLNTLTGVRSVNQDLVDAMRLMGGKSRDVLLRVIIPATTGSILTGIRIAIPYALVGAVVAELIASNRGLGYLIDDAATQFNTAGVFVALLALSIIAAILNALVDLLDRATSRWKVEFRIASKDHV